MRKNVVISIHDVMPETLDRVEWILAEHLDRFTPSDILLLIVPGLQWGDSQIERLHTLQAKGYEFAGHGWLHRITKIGGLYHAVHSRLISRTAGEHLSYSRDELKTLLNNNFQWFADHGFNAPVMYVPPAWAMGKLSPADLNQLPFSAYETTSGIRSFPQGQLKKLPLLGFEADNRPRALFLSFWNWLNLALSTARKPARLSIHPYDFDYHIADQLSTMLTQVEAVSWQSLFVADS